MHSAVHIAVRVAFPIALSIALAIVLAITVVMIVGLVARCSETSWRARADVGVACLNNGGEWARGWFGDAYECKRSEKR